MYFNDNDFNFKIRFQRILWKMGFWARIEIPVICYNIDNTTNNLKRHDLTDVDVYAEKIGYDFSLTKYIVDCKSGNNVRPAERTFWLRGIMDYTHAEKGFLVKKKISENIRLILDKLNIYGIDSKNLAEMEKLYNSLSLERLFSDEYYLERKKIIDSLTDEYQKIYWYLSQRYWFNQNYVNLKTILIMLEKNEFYKNFKKGNQSHLFLVMEIVISFCRLIFECCNYIIHRNVTEISRGVLEFINGGVNGYTNKINLIKELKPILEEVTPVNSFEKISMIQPTYFESFVKLVATFISEPYNCIDIMRYLELIQHGVITKKDINISEIIGATFSPVSLKLAKDVIRFYLDISKIDKTLFEDIMNK